MLSDLRVVIELARATPDMKDTVERTCRSIPLPLLTVAMDTSSGRVTMSHIMIVYLVTLQTRSVRVRKLY